MGQLGRNVNEESTELKITSHGSELWGEKPYQGKAHHLSPLVCIYVIDCVKNRAILVWCQVSEKLGRTLTTIMPVS